MVRKNAPWDMIPKDWDVVVLGEYSEIARGGSPRPIQDYLTSSCRGINWIKIGDVSKNSKYIFSTAEKIILEGVPKSRSVFSGDLILSNSMSFGRPYILKIDGCIHDGWLVIQNYQSAFDKEYLYYCLRSEFTIQQYIRMAAGSSVQNLNKDKVSAVIIAKPPIQEQTAIADSLSDVDNLIFSLQKLIEKKKAIKQGTMQELLTGKKRLPGFSGVWSYRSLGILGDLSREVINPQSLSETSFYEYSMPAYDNGRQPEKMFGKSMHSSRLKIYGDIILFNKLNVRQRRVWHVKECLENAVCSSEFLPYRSLGVHPEFLYQVLLCDKTTVDFENMSTGTSNSQKRITPSDFLEYEIALPEKDEQEAIAQVLSDMDNDIEQLEKKLAKYQQIKQGMMQELLTGRIRLV